MAETTGATVEWRWQDPTTAPYRLAGFAWFATDRRYRRLPLMPAGALPEAVDRLANSTAGGQVQFQTDSPRLAVRVRLSGPPDMDHMPATGQCGFDCYAGPPKRQRFLSVTRMPERGASYEAVLFDMPQTAMRNVTLNFPLYQGVEEVLVGLAPGAAVEAPPPYDDDRPICVYGTSITQGGCASRPGMGFTNILSRQFNRPFVNLGFSGSGKGEPEVARVMAQVPNPAAFVLDYEANAWQDGLYQRTLPGFIAILRERHEKTPILVVSRIRCAVEAHRDDEPRGRAGRLERRDFQKQLVKSLRAAGDRHIAFCDGGDLLGEDFDECTVDGTHPTDLGFSRMAQGLAPAVADLLGIEFEVGLMPEIPLF